MRRQLLNPLLEIMTPFARGARLGAYVAGATLALSVVGADRILFATDHPFVPSTRGRAYIDEAPLSDADKAKVMELRAKGEELHKAGDHDGSMAALNEAKEMLGL